MISNSKSQELMRLGQRLKREREVKDLKETYRKHNRLQLRAVSSLSISPHPYHPWTEPQVCGGRCNSNPSLEAQI